MEILGSRRILLTGHACGTRRPTPQPGCESDTHGPYTRTAIPSGTLSQRWHQQILMCQGRTTKDEKALSPCCLCSRGVEGKRSIYCKQSRLGSYRGHHMIRGFRPLSICFAPYHI